MSLVATSSPWTNEDTVSKKRIPSIRKTIKLKPQSSQLTPYNNDEDMNMSIENFQKTSNFVYSIQNQQGFKIACIEEIAYLNKWIGNKEINNAIKFYGKCEYSKYISNL